MLPAVPCLVLRVLGTRMVYEPDDPSAVYLGLNIGPHCGEVAGVQAATEE